MPNLEIRRDEVAQRYGRVLFDLAQENKILKTVLKESALLQKCLQGEEREWSYVVNPTIPLKTQSHIIESLASSLKLGMLMKRFLSIVCQNRRLRNLTSILAEFAARAQWEEGVAEGVIETAIPLSKKEMEDLQKSLKQAIQKDISLRQDIQKNLLAGVVVRMGSIMVDASLGTQLNKLRQAMKG